MADKKKSGGKSGLIKTIIIIVEAVIIVALGVVLFGMLGKMKDGPQPPQEPSPPSGPPAATVSAELPTYDLEWM